MIHWKARRRPSGATMTYKILFNDAVAMTGGQTHEGELSAGGDGGAGAAPPSVSSEAKLRPIRSGGIGAPASSIPRTWSPT